MMKRVFALILAGALSVSLFAGCGGNKEPAAEGSTPAASGEACLLYTSDAADE